MWQGYLQEKISEAIGASVVFEKLSISPFRGVADGRGLVARVGEGATPFLTIERVQLKLKMSDLLAKQLTIETVLLERPVLTIERGGDGTWNVPLQGTKPPPPPPAVGQPAEPAESSSSGWAAGVKQLILTNGSATYRDHSPGFDGYTLEATPINLQIDQPAQSATVTGNIGPLRRVDRPAELGSLRIIGEGTGLESLPDLRKIAGKLTIELPNRLRADVEATANQIRVSLASQLALSALLPMLPRYWSEQVPSFLANAQSDLKWNVTLDRG